MLCILSCLLCPSVSPSLCQSWIQTICFSSVSLFCDLVCDIFSCVSISEAVSLSASQLFNSPSSAHGSICQSRISLGDQKWARMGQCLTKNTGNGQVESDFWPFHSPSYHCRRWCVFNGWSVCLFIYLSVHFSIHPSIHHPVMYPIKRQSTFLFYKFVFLCLSLSF